MCEAGVASGFAWASCRSFKVSCKHNEQDNGGVKYNQIHHSDKRCLRTLVANGGLASILAACAKAHGLRAFFNLLIISSTVGAEKHSWMMPRY